MTNLASLIVTSTSSMSPPVVKSLGLRLARFGFSISFIDLPPKCGLASCRVLCLSVNRKNVQRFQSRLGQTLPLTEFNLLTLGFGQVGQDGFDRKRRNTVTVFVFGFQSGSVLVGFPGHVCVKFRASDCRGSDYLPTVIKTREPVTVDVAVILAFFGQE